MLDNRQKPMVPKVWSNPQSVIAYFKTARENLLNIVPPSSFTQAYTIFPSRMGDTYYISDPNILREILKTRSADFPKSRSTELLLGPVIPDSIFIAEGKKWRDMHDMIIPVFNRSNVDSFEMDIREIVDNYLSQNDLTNAGELEITHPAQELTFDIISQILISNTNDPELQNIRGMFEDFLNNMGRIQLWDLFAIRYPFLPNIREFTQRSMIKRFQKAGRSLVTNRLSMAEPPKTDFLELLIKAYDLRNSPSRDKIDCVRDNLITFIVAGHETTAMSISWGLYALGHFPEAQKKIAAEADRPLSDMKYTESALKEVMRLYPAAPLLARKTTKAENFDDFQMKPNEGIIVPILAIHRHVDYWENPESFEPERFLNFTPKAMTYLPFGAGPRVCIGASFAMMEAKIIFSQIFSRYEISPSGHMPKAHQVLTMRSSNGIHAVMRKRAG